MTDLATMDWDVSRKGNHWIKLPGAQGPTCTIFRTKDKATEKWGFKWCISRSSKEGPIFSESLFTSVEAAKKACVEKLSALEQAGSAS